MRDLAIKILSAKSNQSQLYFLGQAGFVFISKQGTLLAVDLYLSNCVERYDGYKRLIPPMLSPDEIVFDYVVATHAHYDHFDVDAIPIMMSNEKTKLLASQNCKYESERLGLDENKITYISCGEEYYANDIKINCVICDHGAYAPDAVGLVITINERKIYIAGDTCLRLDQVNEITKFGPFDVMIAPINGAFGNMNEYEMVELCREIKPSLVIPCHFWNFAEHHGDPGLFMKLINERIPGQRYLLMAPGEGLDLREETL